MTHPTSPNPKVTMKELAEAELKSIIYQHPLTLVCGYIAALEAEVARRNGLLRILQNNIKDSRGEEYKRHAAFLESAKRFQQMIDGIEATLTGPDGKGE